MDKYCTFITTVRARKTRFGQHRICGDLALAPHPDLPHNSLCREHLLNYRKFASAVRKAYGKRRGRASS